MGPGFSGQSCPGLHFNPPTPCGVGHRRLTVDSSNSVFQSTHPLRGGTHWGDCPIARATISIHPPLAGWDIGGPGVRGPLALHFNPPTPCGVGRLTDRRAAGSYEFQSTHPLRGGTCPDTSMDTGMDISIHPPLAGWDGGTPPPSLHQVSISIHPPLAGWDNVMPVLHSP